MKNEFKMARVWWAGYLQRTTGGGISKRIVESDRVEQSQKEDQGTMTGHYKRRPWKNKCLC